LVKVNVIEEPQLKRVLEIEIPADEVDGGLREVVEEYRRQVILPGFRKGKAPLDMVKAQMADSLESEYLRKALPKAYMEALTESGLEPAAEPEIKELKFKQGEPLKFNAHIEVWPKFELTGYQGLQMVREEQEITDEEITAEMEQFRNAQATWPGVDRPAQGGDRVALDYWILDAEGNRGEAQSGVIEIGADDTPEPFNQALMGASKGESRRMVLPAAAHNTEEGVHEHPEQTFDIVLTEVREKTAPPLDDGFAKQALGSENADLEALKARVRLSLESRQMMKSRDRLEETLFDELITRNPFEVPGSIVTSALSDVVASAKRERGGEEVPAEEEREIREYYRPAVERRLKSDLIIAAAGKALGVQILQEDVDNEIIRYAGRESITPAEVRGKLKKSGGLDRLRDDMYRHKVIEALLGQARVDVVKKGR